MKKINLARVCIVTLAVLAIPLLAMLVSDEPNWNLFDFIVAGFILITTGLAFEFAAARADNKYRVWLALAFAVGLFLVFAELSVGIIGSPFAGS